VGRGYSFKRWPAIWQWPSHYQQLICHFTLFGLEYTPIPTVPPTNGWVGGARKPFAMRANEYFSKVFGPLYFALAELGAAD
jgi:hypothetical protein